jgi:hypothetical protein
MKPTIISDENERDVTLDTPSDGDFGLWDCPFGHCQQLLPPLVPLSCLRIVAAVGRD